MKNENSREKFRDLEKTVKIIKTPLARHTDEGGGAHRKSTQKMKN